MTCRMPVLVASFGFLILQPIVVTRSDDQACDCDRRIRRGPARCMSQCRSPVAIQLERRPNLSVFSSPGAAAGS